MLLKSSQSNLYSLIKSFFIASIFMVALHADSVDLDPNYGDPGRGPKLRSGMTIAIEPMLNIGTWKTKQLDDGWTVVTEDGALSAHFEHTVAITDQGPEVLT